MRKYIVVFMAQRNIFCEIIDAKNTREAAETVRKRYPYSNHKHEVERVLHVLPPANRS